MRQQHIQTILRSGRRLQTPLVTVYTKALTPPPPRPLAVIVSKKIARRAVRRHQLQRWLREAERHLRQDTPHRRAMVWVARPALATTGRWRDVVASLEKYRATLFAHE